VRHLATLATAKAVHCLWHMNKSIIMQS